MKQGLQEFDSRRVLVRHNRVRVNTSIFLVTSTCEVFNNPTQPTHG